MTLIAHSKLPTFARLKQEGQEVLTESRANQQDIRELHVGVYNMMPDAVLQATERQFLRLIGSSNRIVQFHVHLFSPKAIIRQDAAKQHVEQFYEDFVDLQAQGLDALIITGANPQQPDLTLEPFWDEFCELILWAQQKVTSTMCSCLATHAVFKLLFNEDRIKLAHKSWGVFSHILQDKNHPLVCNVNTKFDAPHSHIYEISQQQAQQHQVQVLATSEEVGLHFAVTNDFRFVFAQGHPEYDSFSLLKEYSREVFRVKQGITNKIPDFPQHYFNQAAQKILQQYTGDFPETAIKPYIYNTWTDTGKAIFNNWLGLVYKITHQDRNTRLMSHLDDSNPLNYPKHL